MPKKVSLPLMKIQLFPNISVLGPTKTLFLLVIFEKDVYVKLYM